MPPIELELRCEIPYRQFTKVLNHLRRHGKFLKHTKRLSVMCFGKVGDNKLDVRIRTTKQRAEVVMKKGHWHAHDRTEVIQKISPNQFLGMTRIFAELDFDMKVGERETYDFGFRPGIVITLGRGGKIVYLEVEKQTTSAKLPRDKKELTALARALNLPPFLSGQQFYALCHRLTKHVDWHFHNRPADYKKLARQLKKY